MNTEHLVSDEFTLLLRTFNRLVDGNPTPKSISQELEDLKASAETSVELNARQKEAIINRCDNYINGIYGNTKEGIVFSSQNQSK